jgi:O-antigen/teichoic acid export membrane protein
LKSAAKNHSPFGRLMWVGLDQLLAAISNFLVVWLCLTSLPTEAFGRFSYSWSTIALFVVLSRALFGIPALLDSESNNPAQIVDMGASLTGTLVLGVVTAVTTFFLYLIGGVSESEVWIFGLFLLAPLLLLQDQIRYLLIASKRTKFAAGLDLLVLSCVLGTAINSKLLGFVGWYLVIGLALGYVLASSIFVFRVPIQLNIRNLRSFLRLDFHRRSRLVSDALLAWGFGLVAITLIRVATGDSGIAVYNGLVFLFGPVALITVFLTLGLQSEVVRTKGNLATRHKVFLVVVSVSPIIWMLIVDAVPLAYVEKLLGPSTEEIVSYTLPFAIAASLGIGLEVLNLFMRGQRKFAEIAIVRLIVGIVLSTSLAVAISAKLGVDQIIWLLATTNLLAAIATVVLLRKASANQAA